MGWVDPILGRPEATKMSALRSDGEAKTAGVAAAPACAVDVSGAVAAWEGYRVEGFLVTGGIGHLDRHVSG